MGPVESEVRTRYQQIRERLKGPADGYSPPPPMVIPYELSPQAPPIYLEAQLAALKLNKHQADRIIGIFSELIFRFVTQPQTAPERVHTMDEVIRLVCSVECVDNEEICSERRDKFICECRQIISYLCCKYTRASTPMIGKRLGHKDHTTILHGRDKMRRLRMEDKRIDLKLQRYEEKLNGKNERIMG